jgi:hypothetical protein
MCPLLLREDALLHEMRQLGKLGFHALDFGFHRLVVKGRCVPIAHPSDEAAARRHDVPSSSLVAVVRLLKTMSLTAPGWFCMVEFIPIKPSVAMASDAPGSYAAHSRLP